MIYKRLLVPNLPLYYKHYIKYGKKKNEKSLKREALKMAKVNCYGYYTGGWYYVQYGNHTGFCSKDWLR